MPNDQIRTTALLGARPFVPAPDVCERHEILVRAPASVVFRTAEAFDMMSLRPVRAIFRLREIVMHAARTAEPGRHACFSDAEAMGWCVLAHVPDLEHVMGSAAQPWLADVVFEPVPVDRFENYAVPDRVKIVWTVEAEALDAELTRLATETRVVATDSQARERFLRYWRRMRGGIVAIRWLLLPAIRREAEHRWKATRPGGRQRRSFKGPEPRIVRERPIPLPPP